MNTAETKFIERQAELLMHSRRMSNAAVRASARAGAPRPRQKGNYTPKTKAKAKPQVSAETAARVGRENLLDHAVRAGIINAGMRDHYRAAYDADPEGCKAFLTRLGLSEAPAGTAQAPAEQEKPSRIVNLG